MYASVAYRSPPGSIIIIIPWKVLYQAGGGGRLPTVPCVRFSTEGGDGSVPSPVMVLYWGGVSLLSPVFGLVDQEGDGSLPSPVFGFI